MNSNKLDKIASQNEPNYTSLPFYNRMFSFLTMFKTKPINKEKHSKKAKLKVGQLRETIIFQNTNFPVAVAPLSLLSDSTFWILQKGCHEYLLCYFAGFYEKNILLGAHILA